VNVYLFAEDAAEERKEREIQRNERNEVNL
jgi:hypothetical protein